MPKVTGKKDAAINAVTTGLGTVYLAPMVAVNGKTAGITAADRVAPVNADEVSYAGYARVAISAAEFNALAAGSSAGKRKRTFPTVDKLFVAIPAGAGTKTIISWAICDHATNPLSTSAVFVVDAEFSQAYAEGSQIKAAAGTLSYEE